MSQNHTINKLIRKIMAENRKIKNSANKMKIPMCIEDNCYTIRVIKDGNDLWTANYQHGLLVNKHYVYKEITGSICPEHLKEYYEKHGFK